MSHAPDLRSPSVSHKKKITTVACYRSNHRAMKFERVNLCAAATFARMFRLGKFQRCRKESTTRRCFVLQVSRRLGDLSLRRNVDSSRPVGRSSPDFRPREFSGVQLDEVVHADRLLAGELEKIVRHAVVAPLLVEFGHH
jgi:hypothetical protein